MEKDYGKKNWHIKSDEEQMAAIAEFLDNYFGAIKFIRKQIN